MQLSAKALCELAVKGSTLNKWSLAVSCRGVAGTGVCAVLAAAVWHFQAGNSQPLEGPPLRSRESRPPPTRFISRHLTPVAAGLVYACPRTAGHGAVLGLRLPQHRFRNRVRLQCAMPACGVCMTIFVRTLVIESACS